MNVIRNAFGLIKSIVEKDFSVLPSIVYDIMHADRQANGPFSLTHSDAFNYFPLFSYGGVECRLPFVSIVNIQYEVSEITI